MKIGITSKFCYNFFANGLNQNMVTLYEILEEIGFEPFFLDFTCQDKSDELISHEFLDNKRLVEWKDYFKNPTHIDILLFAGVSGDNRIRDRVHRSNPKAKMVSIHYGNNLLNMMCNWFSGAPSTGDLPPAKDRQDKIYNKCLISEHYLFAKEYYEFMEECPVDTIPYIWDAKFVDKESLDFNLDPTYRPVEKPNLAVLEPNINITKSFLIPLLSICRILETEPESFNKAFIFCSHKLVTSENKSLIHKTLMDTTVLGEPVGKGKVFFDGRERVPHILHRDNPFIISHQHYNALNYTYLEALYYGFPLIHNSEFFSDYGYYYEGFNIIEASNKIKLAIEFHNDNLKMYIDKGKEIIWKYSPHNPVNQKGIESLMLNLMK